MLSTRGVAVSQHLWKESDLTANFLERASDADDGLDAVLSVVYSRDGLVVGHAGTGDREADRLVELDGELDTGARDRMRDQLVVHGLPLDDFTDHFDAFGFPPFKQSLLDRPHF